MPSQPNGLPTASRNPIRYDLLPEAGLPDDCAADEYVSSTNERTRHSSGDLSTVVRRPATPRQYSFVGDPPALFGVHQDKISIGPDDYCPFVAEAESSGRSSCSELNHTFHR